MGSHTVCVCFVYALFCRSVVRRSVVRRSVVRRPLSLTCDFFLTVLVMLTSFPSSFPLFLFFPPSSTLVIFSNLALQRGHVFS